MNKSILTIATGKPVFVDMAVNLARSFFYWHPDTDIAFRLVTDQPEQIPTDLQLKIDLVIVEPNELGLGFSAKLKLDKLITEGQTLFIDSDCLIFENIAYLFDLFKGHEVSVVGTPVASGEWFGDIAAVCLRFNIPHMPKFNGGLYYLEKGAATTAVYDEARKLEKQYDEIGFVRLRGQPNDEVIMSLAMQLHQQTAVPEDGTIMCDPQACRGGYYIDVIKGRRWLVNPPAPNPLHQTWFPFKKVSPSIVHFLGYYTTHYPYKREVYRLRKLAENKLNLFTEISGLISIQVPAQIKNGAKNLFRPVYRLLFGTRKIKRSERIA